MNITRRIFILMLWAVCVVRGDQTVRVVNVGGDVPKPGPVNFAGEEMTFDSAMAKVGMYLGSFYSKGRGDNNDSRCPIKVIVFREGKKTAYDPSVNAAVMRTLSLKSDDSISITDFRQHPKKIEERRQRIERMIELGSTEIVDELLALTTLQSEYDEWRGKARATPDGSGEYLKKEAARLVEGGKGKKILDILDLKLSNLQLEGLGKAHPAIKSTTNLIQTFRDIVSK